ncbi:MAG: S9 family peptidase [Desulfuromonadaceae bacterium]|nr:S9 family peptidase [Desulfuromonadaceae bacterium]
MFRLAIASLLCVTVFAGCAHNPTHPALLAQQMPPLVPVRNYVADLDFNVAYQLSPDGKKIAWIGRSGFGPGIFVKNLASNEVHTLNTRFGRPTWAEDSQSLLVMTDTAGDENVHIFKIDADDNDARAQDLTPFDGATSYIQSKVQNSGDLLIVSNRRTPKLFDLYYYTQATGDVRLLAENPGDVAQWVTDRQGRLYARVRKQEEQLLFERGAEGPDADWKQVFTWSYFDKVAPLEVSSDKQTAWALSNRGRDKLALVKLDMNSGRETVVFEDPRVDISAAFISQKSFQPLMVLLDPDYQEVRILDDKLRSAFQKLVANRHVRFNPISLTRDENLVTGIVTGEDGAQNVLYDIKNEKLTVLGELTRSRVNVLSPLPVQKPISFTSRDGLTIHGYLTLPQGVYAQKLPTVLFVHGGPWARDVWGDGHQAFFLANRGYAVLQVNYRGSSGYGRDFQDKAIGEFAGKMHDDLIDGVDWLIAQGVADPEKVAIYGASYGGYAALVGMTFTPDKFACGIDFVGPADLARLLETAPPYWEMGKSWWYRFVGDPNNPEQRKTMDARSPLFKAAQVNKPLLILHGVNDPRVKFEQSTLMVEALRKAGKNVEFVEFKGDGHGNQKWSNNLKLYRKMEDFLAGCLGGRSSGFDYFELASWAF